MREKTKPFDIRHTATHEAGHAVAHVRLNILQDRVTVEPTDTTAGHAIAEGAEHVWSKEEAADQVLAYCAGYAALAAAGVDDANARLGAYNDFDHADHLIEFWGLGGDLDTWRARAVALMRKPANQIAVQRVADELMRAKTLDVDDIDVMVDIADGEATEADYAQFKALRAQSGNL